MFCNYFWLLGFSFEEQNFKNFDEVQFIKYSFYSVCYLVSYLGNLCQI